MVAINKILLRECTGEGWGGETDICTDSRVHCGDAENRVPTTRNHRQTQPLVNNLYQGMTLDAVTGLYYERERDYSPSLGRWMEQDPAQFINGANTYQFVDSSPVGNVDASGLDVISIVGGASGEIGPVGASGSIGLAADSSGGVGIPITVGFSLGWGFSEFTGVGVQGSTAPTVSSMGGLSSDTTITAGVGDAGSVTDSVMDTPIGPAYTGTAELGEGIGASYGTGASYTVVIPVPLPRSVVRQIMCQGDRLARKLERPYEYPTSYNYVIPHGNPLG